MRLILSEKLVMTDNEVLQAVSTFWEGPMEAEGKLLGCLAAYGESQISR